MSKRNKKENLFIDNLAGIPSTSEDNVAIMIHRVSGGNQAIDLKWPLETIIDLCDSDGENLQASFDASMWRGGFTCEEHGSHTSCSKVSNQPRRQTLDQEFWFRHRIQATYRETNLVFFCRISKGTDQVEACSSKKISKARTRWLSRLL
jgi:hypothetical protein